MRRAIRRWAHTRRRTTLFTLAPAALAAAAGLRTPARAQAYPIRPIRIVVPCPPGSGTDIVARLLAQKISENWGQQVIVDNKPGAGAIVGVEAVARAAPDGYTIGIGDTGPLATASRINFRRQRHSGDDRA
jgi:tripartite-type tricarboxylate transporter receptor subunit TctC